MQIKVKYDKSMSGIKFVKENKNPCLVKCIFEYDCDKNVLLLLLNNEMLPSLTLQGKNISPNMVFVPVNW